MNKNMFRVLARKEVIYAVAGASASTAAYFVGVKRERNRILSLYAVANLVREEIPATDIPYVPGVYSPDPNQGTLDEMLKLYGPHHQDPDYTQFERQAQPLADEILGVTDGVEVDSDEYEQRLGNDWSMFKDAVDTLPEEGLRKILGVTDGDVITEMESDDEGLTLHLVRENVFASASSDGRWDMDEEIASRTPNKPYIIHVDEFVEQESDYDQSTLTYFAGDGVVADELNQPVEDWVAVLGALRFGHGTPDANAVYIRNEKLKHEFEVLLVNGSYLEEVMGQEAELAIERDEIKHSMEAGMRMRRE